MCGVACAVVAVVCIAALSGIRTFSHATDIVCVIAAVAAYVVATAFAWRIWPHAAGFAAGVLAAPLLALAAVALWLGAEVFPVLGSIVLIITAPPQYTDEVSPTLSCRVYVSGAFTDMGYTVYVLRHPPFVPIVQLEVAHAKVYATRPGGGPPPASCASVAAPLR
ncbi:MAG TPA: hypothetical protein VHS78_02945 [Candidatus Elarobacter sp.]|nr:hypothetical protein [Candidatus Elarobacter sp.]